MNKECECIPDACACAANKDRPAHKLPFAMSASAEPDLVMPTVSYDAQDTESGSENQPLVRVPDDVHLSSSVRGGRSASRLVKENLLLILTILSVVVGITVGLSVHVAQPGRVCIEIIALPGELFLRMLKMLILPLIIFSLMAGLGSLDTRVAGALGWRTVVYYLTTTVLAVLLGLTLVMVIRPGARGTVKKPCDNSTFSVQGHELETLDAILDLLR